jgi:hypothetical protein
LLFIKKDIDNNKTTVIFNEKWNYAIISPIKKQALEAVEKLGLKKWRKDEAFCQWNDASLLEILKAKIDKSYQLTWEETNQSIQIKSEYTWQQSNSEDLSER